MKVFIDANILIDIFDDIRPSYEISYLLYDFLVSNKYELFTSCDIITTVYYVGSKKDKKQALTNIRLINKTLKVIEFSNKEVEQTCSLMLNNPDYKDLEDTVQYIMAKKYGCDLIISNDKNFVSKDIKLLTSKEFCEKYIDDKAK